jgi:hypothetical protein
MAVACMAVTVCVCVHTTRASIGGGAWTLLQYRMASWDVSIGEVAAAPRSCVAVACCIARRIPLRDSLLRSAGALPWLHGIIDTVRSGKRMGRQEGR